MTFQQEAREILAAALANMTPEERAIYDDFDSGVGGSEPVPDSTIQRGIDQLAALLNQPSTTDSNTNENGHTP